MSSKPVKGSDGTGWYQEIEGDLFKSPDTSSLAHCVSADLKMGKGIATMFRDMFKGMKELERQNVPVGGCAKLKQGGRYVYYLITKKNHWDKPKYDTLHRSLSAMAQHCENKAVKELSMPQIGCGLDRLEWPRVASIIKDVFKDKSVNITVYITYKFGGPLKPMSEKRHSTKRKRSPDSYSTDPEKPESYCSAPGYQEIEGDLFESPKTSSLAHCVSYDLKMGKGIAIKFRNMFQGEDDLWNQDAPVGGCAKLKRGERYVYYLITKKNYWDKPTYATLHRSLSAMAQHCENKAVKELSMPQIGCGLDRLEWPRVASIIKDVFKDKSVNITVYKYGGPWKPKKKKQRSAKRELSPNTYSADPRKSNTNRSHSGHRKSDRYKQDMDRSAPGRTYRNCSAPGKPNRHGSNRGERDRHQGPPGKPYRRRCNPWEHDRHQGVPGKPYRRRCNPWERDRHQGVPGKPYRRRCNPWEHDRHQGVPRKPYRRRSNPWEHDRYQGASGNPNWHGCHRNMIEVLHRDI